MLNKKATSVKLLEKTDLKGRTQNQRFFKLFYQGRTRPLRTLLQQKFFFKKTLILAFEEFQRNQRSLKLFLIREGLCSFEDLLKIFF